MEANIYNTEHLPTWCPGCGDFGIWGAIKNALLFQKLLTSHAVFVYGIGCNSNMFNFLKIHGFESLHGRPIPVAEGIRIANHKTPVVVIAGDGDTFGEGTNHLVHAAKRNIDMTVMVHDNQVYGLTTGQISPTASKGFKTKSTPTGSTEDPYNPLAIALSGGATFVARGFAGDIPHLTQLIISGMKHKGFSFLDILQPCVTFNHVNTYQWYRERIYKLEKSGYVSSDRKLAFAKAYEGFYQDGKIPIGIFFEEEKLTHEEQLPQLKNTPLRDQPVVVPSNLSSLFEELH